ncbi:MAG: hypothetical protein O2880_03345 [Proteobacteria bacterium]|nr:hypothetical protein [Pseudomonadota bacterium]
MARNGASAIIVLPPGAQGRIGDEAHKRWLSRGRISFAEPDSEMLVTVLKLIGAPVPNGGLAALRYWGQSGERSTTWMAAADPVHLETRLHTLRLRSLRPDEVTEHELQTLFDHLQATVGNDSNFSFVTIGQCGYLRTACPIDTVPVSAQVLHGLPPDEFVPSGETVAKYHQLLGELQMALHEHDVNQRRARSGQPEINSLWLWGGGIVAEPVAHPLPTLFANDPLFRGYWNQSFAEVKDWDGDIERVVEKSDSGFVAVLPEPGPEIAARTLTDCLDQLKRLAGRPLVLLFRDGLAVEINRWDALRPWRSVAPILNRSGGND